MRYVMYTRYVMYMFIILSSIIYSCIKSKRKLDVTKSLYFNVRLMRIKANIELGKHEYGLGEFPIIEKGMLNFLDSLNYNGSDEFKIMDCEVIKKSPVNYNQNMPRVKEYIVSEDGKQLLEIINYVEETKKEMIRYRYPIKYRFFYKRHLKEYVLINKNKK